VGNELKKSLLLCFLLFKCLFLFAHDDDADDEWGAWTHGVRSDAKYSVLIPEDDAADEEAWVWETWEAWKNARPVPARRERFAIPNRTFELSIMQTNFRIGNTFIAYGDFFQSPFRILRNLIDSDSFADFRDDPSNYYRDNIFINIDNFFDGFVLQFGLDVAPLSINFNMRDRWGFGLDIAHISASGSLNLPRDALSLSAGSELFGAGGAVFVEFGVPVFFHANRFRVSLRPAAYLPLLHIRPGITYVSRGYRFEVSYDMRVFSPFSLEGLFGNGNGDADVLERIMEDPAGFVLNGLGYDISLGVEYPLFPWLSIGVNLVNIPLFPGTLDYYVRLRGNAFFDTGNIDVGGILDDENGYSLDDVFGFTAEDASFGEGAGQRILRPFTMLFYADLRPFGTPTVALIPSLGFSINQQHAQVAALEGGLSARFDLANILITTVGINYNDRMWSNSLDLALNFRILEIGFGLSMQSPRFVRSFQGTGFGVSFGLKIGW